MDLTLLNPVKKIVSDNYYECDNCNLQLKRKYSMITHLKKCEKGILTNQACKWCNLKFKNLGNLTSHAMRMHGDSSYKLDVPELKKGKFKCNVCHCAYSDNFKLRYHIRKAHFNLTSRDPYCEIQQVNQVWFEKVLNTNIIVEMRKMDHNTLVIKKINNNPNVQIFETYRKVEDLSTLYPIGRSIEKVLCPVCKVVYMKRDLKKHMDEKHGNIKKHRCNNCCRSFKRSYSYLKHVCNKIIKTVGVRKQSKKNMNIASVESLVPKVIE